MKQNWLQYLMVVLICSLLPNIREIQAQPNSRFLYAYLVQAENGTVTVKGIAPDNPSQPVELFSFVLPFHWYVKTALPSPDGQWIALVLATQGQNNLRLLNVMAGNVQNVGIAFADVDLNDHSYGPSQQLAWSSDSKVLAFIGTTNSNHHAYLYSVQDGKVRELTSSGSNAARLTWQPSQPRLATLTEACTLDENCALTLDIFDTVTGTRLKTHVLGESPANPAGAFLCNLLWSPNGRYVAFMKDCRNDVTSSTKELYLIDTDSGAIIQLTSFASHSNVSSDLPTYMLHAQYDAVWLNEQRLLVGVNYLADNAKQIWATQTMVYNVPDAVPTKVSEMMFQSWNIVQKTHKLAFLSSAFDRTNEFSFVNPTVQIAKFDADNLHILAAAPAGCDLHNSPDGTYLGYTDRGRPLHDCTGRITGIKFIDITTLRILEQPFSSEQFSDKAMVIGWVRNKSVIGND